MLFEPSLSLNIIPEEDYFTQMETVEKKLALYANKGFFPSFDSAEISYEYYLVKNPKASVVFVHGYTEFSKKYHEITWYFLNMGYNVFLYDHRGHGYSHRYSDDLELTHVESYSDYSGDLTEYIEKIVLPQSNGCDINLYSHSMGGAVSLLYLSEGNAPVKKALLSAPMIHPTSAKGPRKLLRFLLKTEAKKHGWNAMFKFSHRFNPDVKFETSNMDSSKNRFLYNLEMRKCDPHYQTSASTNRWNYETLKVKDIILSKRFISRIKAEMLIVRGEKDDVVRPSAQNKFAKKSGCRLITISNAKHSLCTLKDAELKKYLNCVFDFFNK